MTFEQLDRSIDADSDSDDDLAEQAHLYRREIPLRPAAAPDTPQNYNPGALLFSASHLG